MRKQAIYKEVDPRDNLMYYIGRALNPYQRHKQHLREKGVNEAKHRWIESLAADGLEPIIEIIEWCDGDEVARKREVFWIEDALQKGMPLTNLVSKNPVLMTDSHAAKLQGRREERTRQHQDCYRFELVAFRFGLTVIEKKPGDRYLIKGGDETQKEREAVILPCSFDFYERRLHTIKHRFDLVIVEYHNAVVPVEVLDLATSSTYDPYQPPAIDERSGAKRPNHDEAMLLVSKLILGIESAKEELSKMPYRTRRRYLQRCDEYLRPRVGRPWAS